MLDNNLNTTYPPTGPVKSASGVNYLIPNLPVGNAYTTFCQPPGESAPTPCSAGFFFSNDLPMPNVATTDYLSSAPSLDLQSSLLSGTLTLQDGSPCGTLNEFFGVHVTGTATLLDASNNPMGTSVRLNELGDYSLVYNFQSPPASVSLSCETAAALVVPITLEQLQAGEMNTSVLPGVTAPQVQSMSATLNGSTIASVNFISPPPAPLPSDILPRADGYLAEKGLDTRLGACQYYKAVGAVKACDATGNLLADHLSGLAPPVRLGISLQSRSADVFRGIHQQGRPQPGRVHQSIRMGRTRLLQWCATTSDLGQFARPAHESPPGRDRYRSRQRRTQ